MWNRVTPPPYASDFSYDYAQRFYRYGDTDWPLVCVSLYPWVDFFGGLRIGIDRKADMDSYWLPYSLPKELIPELIDMLQQFVDATS